MWMAQCYLSSGGNTGDLELKGKEYFDNLKTRSFFQDFEEYGGRALCKMHDIVHDFAQFLRKNKRHKNMEEPNGRVGATTKETSQACDPSLVSQIKVYRSLTCEDTLPFPHPLKSLSILRVLECKGIPTDIENLIQLRYLDINRCFWLRDIPQTMFKLYNLETLYLNKSGLKEIPKEIGNLVRLRHLDLSNSEYIKELPATIYNLHHMRTLNLAFCTSLEKLPQGIDRLVNLKQLINKCTATRQIPQGFEQLTGLRMLNEFRAGRGYNKLGHLNKLDKLSGEIDLYISLHGAEDVVEAHKAELRNKIHIQILHIRFFDEMGRTNEEESMRYEVMEALQPPPNLSSLKIVFYKGIEFPGWITYSLNYLRDLEIQNCDCCSVLPPLGKLPFLEELQVHKMDMLQFLGREFLGIASSEDINASSSSPSLSPSLPVVTGFPRLKELIIYWCGNLKEWEDITAEEEGSATVSIMPCLMKLRISSCDDLIMLPHRLLRKASSLQHLQIWNSTRLYECYKDKEGSNWRSLSHIPHVEEYNSTV